MQIKFNDKDYVFPSSLAEITLGQRIEFYNLHGKILDERAKVISEMTDAFNQELEQTQWYLDVAARSMSFYCGIDYEVIKSQASLSDLLTIYNEAISILHQQEKNIELLPVYNYNGEEWCLDAPELGPSSTMVFNEFIHSKETVRQMEAIGKSKWDSLPFLCAIYLRRKDEPFEESFVYPDSERLKLMHALPLDIALAVGFFLSGTLSIYSAISQYSTRVKQKESIQPATLSAGDG